MCTHKCTTSEWLLGRVNQNSVAEIQTQYAAEEHSARNDYEVIVNRGILW